MNATLTIDKAGCVILPKAVRDALQINPGDSPELESSDDHIVLRPARGRARIHKSGPFMATHPSPQSLSKRRFAKLGVTASGRFWENSDEVLL
jgi:AbrB family looped-hinge helix DNA binding protein